MSRFRRSTGADTYPERAATNRNPRAPLLAWPDRRWPRLRSGRAL